MVRLVLFDIDGTLISSGGAGEKSFARVFANQFGIHNGTEGLQFAGRTDPAIVREFFLRHRIEPTAENFARFFDSYLFWLDHMLPQLRGTILAGVTELISALQSLPNPPLLGLLTGNVRLGAQIKLGHYQLWHHFQTGGFGDDHEDRCEVAAVALQRGRRFLGNGLSSEEVVVIGDTPLDVACANAIKAKVLAVATGKFSAAELRQHHPTWTVENLAQMSARELCQ